MRARVMGGEVRSEKWEVRRGGSNGEGVSGEGLVGRGVVGYWTTDFTNGHEWFLGLGGLWGEGA
jgi:hypothetical protein